MGLMSTFCIYSIVDSLKLYALLAQRILLVIDDLTMTSLCLGIQGETLCGERMVKHFVALLF